MKMLFNIIYIIAKKYICKQSLSIAIFRLCLTLKNYAYSLASSRIAFISIDFS